jgi:tetratricopeptide (TPR) repeat protein
LTLLGIAEKFMCSFMPMNTKDGKKLIPLTRDLDIKIEFFEGLIRRDPDFVDALQLLGDHYTQRGRINEGLRVDERLARLEPKNPIIFYNLACSYALTENFEGASFALERSIKLGYRDFQWLAKDPDLKNFRAHPSYRELKIKIRKLKNSLNG